MGSLDYLKSKRGRYRTVNEPVKLGVTRGKNAAIVCTRCDKTGHTSRDHFPPGHPFETLKCERCGLRGHEAINCDLPKDATAYIRRLTDPTSEG